jgi:hypothetical protein
LDVYVNRTPVTGEIEAGRDGRDIDAYGCGLSHTIAKAPKESQFGIQLNITTPFMPITSDGKAPDLWPFLDEIKIAVEKAVRKAHQPNASGRKQSIKDVVLAHLHEAIAEVGGGFQFNQRQLFYYLRPISMTEAGRELQLANFTAIITDYEADFGEIRGHVPRAARQPLSSAHR